MMRRNVEQLQYLLLENYFHRLHSAFEYVKCRVNLSVDPEGTPTWCTVRSSVHGAGVKITTIRRDARESAILKVSNYAPRNEPKETTRFRGRTRWFIASINASPVNEKHPKVP